MKIAVQLYTLRDLIHNGDDLLAILGEVKKLGFDGVEFAGYQGLPAETLKKRLDEVGLVPVGSHIGLDDWRADKIEKTIAYQKALGAKAAGIGGCDTSNEAALSDMLSVMGSAYKRAAKDGITVYFHTHTGEFKPTEGSSVNEDIIDRIKKVCATQIDTYWSFYAGVDTCRFLRDNREHIPFIHVKDGLDGKPKALGEGNNELDNIINTAREIGLEWIILENDDPEPDGLSDIARSMKWLRAHGADK